MSGAARKHSAETRGAAAGAARSICAPPDRALPGEGEEHLRRVLEDLVIARQRDPANRVGVSVAELAEDLGVSRQRVQRMISADSPEVNLRAGQILSLRPRVRALVLAALAAQSETLGGGGLAEDVALHRRIGALYGRLSETLDRALADGRIDDDERAELRAAWAQIAAEAGRGAGDR